RPDQRLIAEHGRESLEYARLLRALGKSRECSGQFGTDNTRLLSQAFGITERSSGRGSAEYAKTLRDVAELSGGMYLSGSAQSMFREAVARQTDLFGELYTAVQWELIL